MLGCCSMVLPATAQQRCATVEYQQQLQQLRKLPELNPQFENWIQQKKALRKKLGNRIQSTYKIPVVVHIIHNGENIGTGTNISVAQIESQLAVLNKDFNRLNDDATDTPAEFTAVASGMSIEFVLATRSPEGCQTNGIVRINGKELTGRTSWNSGLDVQIKSLSIWPAEDYLNLWVCNLTDYLGYAQFPVSDLPGLEEYQNELASTDGVVFSHKVFGSNDYGNFNLDPQYNKGRTATHELGHFFGLRHIWGDLNGCAGTDYVSDTPTQREETYDCPGHPLAVDQWCNGAAPMFQNYMDYTDDACMNLFTAQQVDRMINVIENSPRRNSLLTSTGADAPVSCGNDVAFLKLVAPSIVTPDNTIAPVFTMQNFGETLQSLTVFYGLSNDNLQQVNLTDLNLFPTETMEIELPAIDFAAGENTLIISLTSPNGGVDYDQSNNEYEGKVIVNSSSADIPVKQNFELPFAESWVTTNATGNINWEPFSLSASVNVLYVNAFDNASLNEEAWFVTPSLDLSKTRKAFLNFYYSYSPRAGKTDKLEVRVSTDCGLSYAPYSTIDLDGTTTTSEWRPRSSADWQQMEINLNDVALRNCVRLAFVFTNGNGNNLYLDEIKIGMPPPFTIYPNPTQAEINVAFNLAEETEVEFEVLDVRGTLVGNETYLINPETIQTQTFNAVNLQAGIYFVRMKTSAGVWLTRLVVTK